MRLGNFTNKFNIASENFYKGQDAIEYLKFTKYSSIRFVKKKDQTYEMALIGVSKYPDDIKYVRQDLIDEQLALLSVKFSGLYIRHIPSEVHTNKVVMQAIKVCPDSICYVKDKKPKYIYSALRKSLSALKYIPKDLIDQTVLDILNTKYADKKEEIEYVLKMPTHYPKTPEYYENNDIEFLKIKIDDNCFNIRNINPEHHSIELYCHIMESYNKRKHNNRAVNPFGLFNLELFD